ncbi:MAG TPA: MmcB family DNA repair protein [Kiloniellales bacterium]
MVERRGRPWLDFKPEPPSDHDALADDLALYLRTRDRPMMTWRNITFYSGDCVDLEWLQREIDWHTRCRNDRYRQAHDNWPFKLRLAQAAFRPDVFALRAQISTTALHPHAYEVKISRADFLADVRAGKWRHYRAIAEAVYFAVPDQLVDPREVPEGAGLIVRKRDHWRRVIRASGRSQWQPTDRFWLTLLIRGRDPLRWERGP